MSRTKPVTSYGQRRAIRIAVPAKGSTMPKAEPISLRRLTFHEALKHLVRIDPDSVGITSSRTKGKRARATLKASNSAQSSNVQEKKGKPRSNTSWHRKPVRDGGNPTNRIGRSDPRSTQYRQRNSRKRRRTTARNIGVCYRWDWAASVLHSGYYSRDVFLGVVHLPVGHCHPRLAHRYEKGTEVAEENVKAAKASAEAARAQLEFTKTANEQNLNIAKQSTEAAKQSAEASAKMVEVSKLSLKADLPYVLVVSALVGGVHPDYPVIRLLK